MVGKAVNEVITSRAKMNGENDSESTANLDRFGERLCPDIADVVLVQMHRLQRRIHLTKTNGRQGG